MFLLNSVSQLLLQVWRLVDFMGMKRAQVAQVFELVVVFGICVPWSMWTTLVRWFRSVDRGGPKPWSRTPL